MNTEEKLDHLILMIEHLDRKIDDKTGRIAAELHEFRHEMKQETQFGKKYKTIGMRKNKLICVGCTVAACVCIITAVQILLMFRTVLWG